MNRLLRVNYQLYAGIFFVTVLLFLTLFGPILAPHTLTEALETKYTNGTIISPPLDPYTSKEWPLGTDKWGYDLLSMVLHGIRYTVFIAVAVTVIKMLFGTIAGLYIGTWKKTPGWMVAFENAWSYVPLFLILYFLLIPIPFNSQIDPVFLVFYFIIIASIISIPSIISSVRQKSAEFYKSVYVEAARALGARRSRIVWGHIFPQMKESLLVMFILEIVYVIAIMGQLALMNIFVGGTFVTYDPLMYFSKTKELAGLVGQARGNIYGSHFILLVPLAALLITTASFSLLANGLKNRFQSNYQRSPWIKTGIEPRLMPKRKSYSSTKKWWKLTPPQFAFLALILLFISAGTYVYATKDSDIGVRNGSQAAYNLSLEMNKDGEFSTEAEINVKNQSGEKWDELVFYFIPNSFTEGHPFKNVKGFSAVDIRTVKIDGEQTEFSLAEDTLKIALDSPMKNREKRTVTVSYEFTVPEEGVRFSTVRGNYYLAQWYPMLATYQNRAWNKEDYSDGLETFHTGFSDFNVEYSIPSGYSFVSTADKDGKLEGKSGKVEMEYVRDFFIAVVKDMDIYETESQGVNIRLFTRNNHDKDPEKALQLAKKALGFYQDNIGKYPHKQLDIMFDKGQFMEYPGIVTINPYIEDDKFYEISIVHEIAHQYFYGVVSNDPYNEAWLDEGFTEFATNMYFYLAEKQPLALAQRISENRMKSIEEKGLGRQHSNLPLHENKHSGYIYGQPALKLTEMVKKNSYQRENEFDIVVMEYLSDYYHQFRYKEVNTEEFLKFTMNYFKVPRGSFTDWLQTEE
ncbi:ABC transporter permease subunit [Mesobacillus harenae]|uniref:ABC transporter permease subunit n=1 Tax=Mesobacillus harenae TaxID=2213203 RepID=UPI0015805A95|nr:ABC transporter permease subunit [Mesobacillus harenae]